MIDLIALSFLPHKHSHFIDYKVTIPSKSEVAAQGVFDLNNKSVILLPHISIEDTSLVLQCCPRLVDLRVHNYIMKLRFLALKNPAKVYLVGDKIATLALLQKGNS